MYLRSDKFVPQILLGFDVVDNHLPIFGDSDSVPNFHRPIIVKISVLIILAAKIINAYSNSCFLGEINEKMMAENQIFTRR